MFLHFCKDSEKLKNFFRFVNILRNFTKRFGVIFERRSKTKAKRESEACTKIKKPDVWMQLCFQSKCNRPWPLRCPMPEAVAWTILRVKLGQRLESMECTLSRKVRIEKPR